MCERRTTGLRQIVSRARTIRPIQTVPPEPSSLVCCLFILFIWSISWLVILRLVISGTKRVDHLDGGGKQLDESKCQCQGPSRTNRVAWNGANLRQWNQYCFEGKTWKLKKATIVFDWMWIKNCLVIWKLDNKNRDIGIRWSIQILTSQFRFSWPKKRTSFLATCPRFVLFTVRYSCQILRAAYPAHS